MHFKDDAPLRGKTKRHGTKLRKIRDCLSDYAGCVLDLRAFVFRSSDLDAVLKLGFEGLYCLK